MTTDSHSSIHPAAVRSLRALVAVAIALIAATLLYAVSIGALNYGRIGV